MSHELVDLPFSDLIVAPSNEESFYKATPDAKPVTRVPSDCHEDLDKLRAELLKRDYEATPSFSIEWSDVSMRVQYIKDDDGKPEFRLRRFRVPPSNLPELGMPPGIASKLMSPTLENGLIVFCGKMGSGKTTTQGAFVVDRLKQFAGDCITLESPKELILEGFHGKGHCTQKQVNDENELPRRIKDIYRAGAANMLMIGEIRDGAAMREALEAAKAQLVITTFHANDIPSCLSRIVGMANMAGSENAKESLSTTLAAIIHLGLYNDAGQIGDDEVTGATKAGTGKPPRILATRSLWLHDEKNSTAIKSKIRDGAFEGLKSEIEQQRNLLISRGAA